MTPIQFHIDPDIRKASTIDTRVYTDPDVFDAARDRIFARIWHFVADIDEVRRPGQVFPVAILENYLDEPVVLTRDKHDQLRCLSNVCTHRGNLVAHTPSIEKCLTCAYHGRRFKLDGRFEYMPEFGQAENFPSDADHLRPMPLEILGNKFVCMAIDPVAPFSEWTADLNRRVGHLPLQEFKFDPARSRDYLVRANWALYCENYLEGFHIPFVHSSLNDVLDYGEYATECRAYDILQLGYDSGGDEVFQNVPSTSPEAGKPIAAYYYFLFPNLMMNFYPWGLSINIVKPLAVDRTRVSFLTYVWDESSLDRGAGAGLDRVEREDEAIVECVQRGVRSRNYHAGRYSPSREQGVHAFHRMLARFLND